MSEEKEMRIGFVGGGALTESIIKGINGTLLPADRIFVSDHKRERCAELINKYNINATVGVDSFIDKISLLVVAVKPKDAEATFKELVEYKDKITLNLTIISVIAGLKISAIEKYFPNNTIVRAMPNVALSVGEGMTAYIMNKNTSSIDRETIKKLWSTVGRAVEVDEKLMDAVTGLSGSGSAYAFLMIEAMADGGVAAGLTKKVAVELAAQTLLGAAKMVLESEESPTILRDKVTSPGGTTIEGVRMLERGSVRSSLIEAVLAATEKSKKL